MEFYRAIPVLESEVRLKIARGLAALQAIWKEGRTPYWDPNRSDPVADRDI
ncbi:hypothetical protein AB0M47_10775 [Hamadaea sp. NPDC051192]|uniref:hypothetical protein n=1 Tax=Hamadaea sp. NPDC051192 TaxID=3154940 RepID=UPI003440B994